MQAEFIVSIGLNDKDSMQQEINTDAAKQIIFDVFGDCTLQLCAGQYTHNSGEVVRENSCRVFTYADHTEKPVMVEKCRRLKTLLNQECIVLSWRPCGETDFI